MSSEQNKAALRRWMESWNTRDASVLESMAVETFAVDFVMYDNAKPAEAMGLEGVRQFIHAALKNRPYIQLTCEDLVAEEDKVAVRYMVSGTDSSTGKPSRQLMMDIFRFADGKIVEDRGLSIPVD